MESTLLESPTAEMVFNGPITPPPQSWFNDEAAYTSTDPEQQDCLSSQKRPERDEPDDSHESNDLETTGKDEIMKTSSTDVIHAREDSSEEREEEGGLLSSSIALSASSTVPDEEASPFDDLQHVGIPEASPSLTELTKEILPMAARELMQNAGLKVYYMSRSTYETCRNRQTTELHNVFAVGYALHDDTPQFSSLSWVDRQLVKEWSTIIAEQADDDEFAQARRIVPTSLPRPPWNKSESCDQCSKPFGPVRLRHHCRMCGGSFCQAHSSRTHRLVHLSYGVMPERVCDTCKSYLLQQNLAERLAWRSARLRDYRNKELRPYFEVGLDSFEDAIVRLTNALIQCAKTIPLGAQATVAVETVDVLRKYGLNGIYTIMLRQEFLAAADLLLKAVGINPTAFPLSVHELAAASFYALAQHRAMRGMNPEYEHETHQSKCCDIVSDEDLEQVVFYAPIALNFVYMEKAVDMQLLAAQQNWRLLYSYLDQEDVRSDRPASALFVMEEEKIACLAIRGTATIQDVVTDIRQAPTPFPGESNTEDDDWTNVPSGQGVAVSGMASAAYNLYREHHAVLNELAADGYKIRLVGHSLGGAVATLLGLLVKNDMPDSGSLHVYAYGPPSCVDFGLADTMEQFVTTVVLHDDIVPRLTPTSCRSLLKHLLHIRETWVKKHLSSDIRAFKDRAKTAWAPKWRGGFTISAASSSRKISRYCKKKLISGKKKLVLMKERFVSDVVSVGVSSARQQTISTVDHEDDYLGRDVSTTQIDELSTLGETVADEHLSCPVVDILGGMDLESSGLVIDGDEFFDTDDVPSSEMDSEHSYRAQASGEPDTLPANVSAPWSCHPNSNICWSDDVRFAMAFEVASDQSKEAVVVEEMPLPNMYLAGKIVHIYSHRGVYKAGYVPRDFRFLRKISLAGNMITDHKTKHYYDALLEIRHVRVAPESAPKWTAFDDDDTW